MTLLASGTLNSVTTTISSISGAYTDLRITVEAAWQSGSGGSNTPSPGLRFNGDSGTNYYNFTATTNGASFDRQSSQFLTANSGTTSYGFAIMDIYDYASTTHWKIGRNLVGNSTHVGGQTINVSILNFVWNSTSAINQLSFGSPNTAWDAGTYKVYGIK
jgi:hypothetical protein